MYQYIYIYLCTNMIIYNIHFLIFLCIINNYAVNFINATLPAGNRHLNYTIIIQKIIIYLKEQSFFFFVYLCTNCLITNVIDQFA